MEMLDIKDILVEQRNKLVLLEAVVTNRNRTLDDIGDGASEVLCEVIDSINRIIEME